MSPVLVTVAVHVTAPPGRRTSVGATDLTMLMPGSMTVTSAVSSSDTAAPIVPPTLGVPVTVAVFSMTSGVFDGADFDTVVVHVYSHSSPGSSRSSLSVSPLTKVTGEHVPGPASSVTVTSWSGTMLGFVAWYVYVTESPS